jgi:hypothetical protein
VRNQYASGVSDLVAWFSRYLYMGKLRMRMLFSSSLSGTSRNFCARWISTSTSTSAGARRFLRNPPPPSSSFPTFSKSYSHLFKSHLHSQSPPPPTSTPRSKLFQRPRFTRTTLKMSSAGLGGGLGSAALYAVVSNPAQVGAQPEDAKELKHHLKNGKGFTNPWESFRDFTPWKILSGMAW